MPRASERPSAVEKLNNFNQWSRVRGIQYRKGITPLFTVQFLALDRPTKNRVSTKRKNTV